MAQHDTLMAVFERSILSYMVSIYQGEHHQVTSVSQRTPQRDKNQKKHAIVGSQVKYTSYYCMLLYLLYSIHLWHELLLSQILARIFINFFPLSGLKIKKICWGNVCHSLVYNWLGLWALWWHTGRDSVKDRPYELWWGRSKEQAGINECHTQGQTAQHCDPEDKSDNEIPEWCTQRYAHGLRAYFNRMEWRGSGGMKCSSENP